ncbi:TfuA-like protein [Desulforhopalus sp. 52FAK]
MTILIFCGPTISAQEVSSKLENAVVLPPPVQGDILAALGKYRPKAIGLIDAGFPRSAWVSELHYALRSGVSVYGAGVQGALRAVELRDYGMKGYGEAFLRVQAGNIGDDALLCHYSQNGTAYIRHTESLLTIEATLTAAYEAGELTATMLQKLNERALHLHWKERNWENILLPDYFESDTKSKDIWTWIERNIVDIAKRDAFELLTALVSEQPQLAGNNYVPIELSGTLAHVNIRERKVERKQGEVPPFSIAHHTALNHQTPLQRTFDAMNRELVNFFAERMEFQVSEEEIEFERRVIVQEQSLAEGSLAKWQEDNDLTQEDMQTFLYKNALCRKMHQWMIMKNGFAKSTGPLLDQLRICGEYPTFAESAAAIETSKRASNGEFEGKFNQYSLEELLALRKKRVGGEEELPWASPYNQSARVLGMNRQELVYELRRETFHYRKSMEAIFDALLDDEQE